MNRDNRKNLKRELHRIAENLDPHKFKPIMPGLGLGQVNRPDPELVLTKPLATMTDQIPIETADSQPGSIQELRRLFPRQEFTPEPLTELGQDGEQAGVIPGVAETRKLRTPSRLGVILGRIVRFGFVHAVDLLCVGVGTCAALIMAGLWFGPAGDSLVATVAGWAPVGELMALRILELLTGIYLLYLLYVILFKLVVGFTFGQLLLGRRTKISSIHSPEQQQVR